MSHDCHYITLKYRFGTKMFLELFLEGDSEINFHLLPRSKAEQVSSTGRNFSQSSPARPGSNVLYA